MISELDMLKWLRANHLGDGYESEEAYTDEDQLENDAWDNRYDPIPGWDANTDGVEWEDLDEEYCVELWLDYLMDQECTPAARRLVHHNQDIRTGQYDLNSWALVNEQYEYIRLAQACVAGLNGISYDYVDEKWLRWMDYNTYHLSGDNEGCQDYQRTMMEYVIERSPYRHAFLITDVNTAIKYGNAYDCTKWTANYIVGAATAHRMAGEIPKMARAFASLRQVFSNEHLAFLACQAVDVVKGTFSVPAYYGSNHSIHSSYSCAGVDAWLRFMADDMTEVNKGMMMSENTNYCNILNAWGRAEGQKYDAKIKMAPVATEAVTLEDSFGMPYTDYLGVSGAELEHMIWETLR